MPIETSQRILALRNKKNAQVADNLARLWDIGRNSHSAEDLLNQLHPWGAPKNLKFDNRLAIFIGFVAGLLFILLILKPHTLLSPLLALISAGLWFLSYLLYASKHPVNEVIHHLEQCIIQKKYQLNYQRQPQALGRPVNPILMMAQLKQHFPIFERGRVSNEIPFFASSMWQEQDSKNHHVLIFQYHFVNDIQVRDQQGDRVSIKEIHQDLWGVFIFDLEHDLPTFAASTEHKKLPYPYHLPWQSSDIQIRQRLYIAGENPLEMAKKIDPAMTLKLGEFFLHRRGELYINQNQNMLCYLGEDNLMQIQSQQNKKIQDISTLRGHLRTFKLPLLERLKKQLLVLLD